MQSILMAAPAAVNERAGSAIEIRGLFKQFASNGRVVSALDGVDLSIQQGEFLCVVGPSGCGKTTLLNILGGLEQASAGTVEFAPQAVALDRSGRTCMSQLDRKPWRLKLVNPLFMMLTRLGLPVGIVYLLTVRGRNTGKPYSTPVSVFTLDGQRYIVSHPTWGWVKNARATREGMLRRGQRTEAVQLIELPLNQRIPVIRAFPKLVPHGVSFFGLPPDPDAFEQAAPRITAFRVEPLTAAGVGVPVDKP